jgi:hypothetical protein
MVTSRNASAKPATEIDMLKERLAKVETKLYVAAAIAAIFGIAGGWGFSLISGARDRLADMDQRLTSQKGEVAQIVDSTKRALGTEATQAVAQAVEKSELGPKVRNIELRLARTGEDSADAESPVKLSAANGLAMDASCPAGQVARGVKLGLGGTCGGKCDADGRPVATLRLVCTQLIAK